MFPSVVVEPARAGFDSSCVAGAPEETRCAGGLRNGHHAGRRGNRAAVELIDTTLKRELFGLLDRDAGHALLAIDPSVVVQRLLFLGAHAFHVGDRCVGDRRGDVRLPFRGERLQARQLRNVRVRRTEDRREGRVRLSLGQLHVELEEQPEGDVRDGGEDDEDDDEPHQRANVDVGALVMRLGVGEVVVVVMEVLSH